MFSFDFAQQNRTTNRRRRSNSSFFDFSQLILTLAKEKIRNEKFFLNIRISRKKE